MKTLFAAILLSAMSFGAFAQQIATAQATTQMTAVQQATSAHSAKAADSYRCPVCGYTSTKAGDCTKDKVTLIKVGSYYCPECYMTAAKACKCSMCGVDMKKMEASTSTATKK